VNGTITRQIEQSLAELRALVAELTRPRRRRIADLVAAHAGISVAEAFAATEIDPDEQAEALERFGRGSVDIAELTRWLAERRGCTAAEIAAAVALAERLHGPLHRAIDTPPSTPEAPATLLSPTLRNVAPPASSSAPREWPARQPPELQAY